VRAVSKDRSQESSMFAYGSDRRLATLGLIVPRQIKRQRRRRRWGDIGGVLILIGLVGTPLLLPHL
jgi:hypothetical protein